MTCQQGHRARLGNNGERVVLLPSERNYGYASDERPLEVDIDGVTRRSPRPLERAEITLSPDDGQIIVDKAMRFLYERGQWRDPKAFLKLA